MSAAKKLRRGGFLIAQIHQLAGRVFAKELKKYNLHEINPAQGRILFALWEKDEIPIQRLAEKTLLEKSTLTSMLDTLEKSGYIKRVPSKKDRRQIIIKLTRKNEKLKEGFMEVSNGMTRLFYKGFGSKEIDEFENSLKRILENLKGA